MSTSNVSEYNFTESQDWFSFNVDTWRLLFTHVKSSAPRALEIGTWEGRSAVFLLNELCGTEGELVCIDHFDLMRTAAGRERYSKVSHNLSITGKSFRIMSEFSVPALMTLLQEEISSASPGFDFLYIDGSHEADDTFLDGELAWRLARNGAIVIFDDYDWSTQPKDSRHHPKRGIDAFMDLHAGEFERLSSSTQYQMVLRKTTEMRIGFLVKDDISVDNPLLDSGLNIVYTVDEDYAMALAVSLRSLLEHTNGRVSVYIAVQSLSHDIREKIRSSLPARESFTLTFLELPETSLASRYGISWAKLDIVDILPVERVLYLDADTLIRGDLMHLWKTDLCGKPIAAADDVGYPLGHDKKSAHSYFNAGVLLLDLALIRSMQTSEQLSSLVQDMIHSRLGDQDVLNAYFQTLWHRLSLACNAQGLGTYASLPSEERKLLHLGPMLQPLIVHFTGPVHPTMNAVLNDWGQPFTAKPWGYAGAPGHPYASEWWKVLDRTEWKGYQSSDVFENIREEQLNRAEKEGIAAFRDRATPRNLQ